MSRAIVLGVGIFVGGLLLAALLAWGTPSVGAQSGIAVYENTSLCFYVSLAGGLVVVAKIRAPTPEVSQVSPAPLPPLLKCQRPWPAR